MADDHPNVKPKCRPIPGRLLSWVDCHPRIGWYMLLWTAAVNLEVTLHWFSTLLHLI